MSNTISIPFAIGSTVWWTGHGAREVTETCPECAGTAVLTLIKGNGERVTLECNNCQMGYSRPTGTVRFTVTEFRPTPFVCNRVTEVRGDVVRYSSASPDAPCYSTVESTDLFATEEECAAACAVKTAAAEVARKGNAAAHLESKRRSLAHSTHYWKRLAETHERDAATCRARLAVEVARKAES